METQEQKERATRLAACWNAMHGITSDNKLLYKIGGVKKLIDKQKRKIKKLKEERDELRRAVELLIDGVDLQVPEGLTEESAVGVVECTRLVSVFDLIRAADAAGLEKEL